MSSGQGDAALDKAAASSALPTEEAQVTAEAVEAIPDGTNTDVENAEATLVAAATPLPATKATSITSPTDAPATGSAARTQSALEALLKVLEGSNDAASAASLRSVQKICMRIPQLSDELTRPQRLQLYTILLLTDDETSKALLPESWTVYAEKALESHVDVAQQAAMLFPESLHITVDELAGLFYHLGAETAFNFSKEMVDVILCMSYVVAGGSVTDKNVLLRTLYQLLYVLNRDFLVSTASRLYEPATTALLRLMLQFYDPALATHIDQHQVEVGTYLLEWSRRLLILHSNYETALKVLDWVFILGDPVMIPFVAEAYLITHRQRLLSLHTKQELTECLSTMEFALPRSRGEAVDPKLADGRATALVPVWNGKSLLQNADLLYRATPQSTQRMLDFCLYPEVGTLSKTPEVLHQYYTSTTCLPLERSDLATAFAKRGSSSTAKVDAELPPREYIIVDCRSKSSYDYVRLPSAILVGDVLSYQQEELEEARRRLEPCRGRPLALFGTGRPIVEEVNLLKVLALFLVNKKAFPFVCIVPGGFKTTIPLLRNRVINAVLSPAAAASFGLPSKSADVDWGQQASSAAHDITAKLSEISELLPHVETAELRQKAESLGSKAKDSVAAAGTWGWGVMQRLREGLSETHEHASVTLSSVAAKLSSTQAAATAKGASAPVLSTPAGNVALPSAVQAPEAAPPPTQHLQQVFSIGEDGEEEDLDLITSIPSRPMLGTVVDAPKPPVVATTPASTTAATEITTKTAEKQPAIVSDSPADDSPAPVSLPPKADKPAVTHTAAAAAAATTTAGAARGASASQIAANIDAEFDELFGDLNMSPPPAARSSASPTKPPATVSQNELFDV